MAKKNNHIHYIYQGKVRNVNLKPKNAIKTPKLSKNKIATDIVNASISIYQRLNHRREIELDDLISASVFIKKAEEILQFKKPTYIKSKFKK